MELIKKLEDFLQTLDSRDFYKYLGIVIVIITAASCVICWRYYSSTRSYLAQIQEINDQRESGIKELFESHERILVEQKQVNKLLDEDPNFKIRQHFEEILSNLRLADKKVTESISSVERENYRESILTITFAAMNMQELCELLQELEKAKRIFTKDIDIQKSNKTPDTIDVTLVIATLLPKTGE